MTEIAIDPVSFRKILGTYPTGVCVVTSLMGDRPLGMVVGSFTSVSLDPPLVGFFPDKSSTSWPEIEKTGRFCVNVMGSDQQHVCRAVAAKGDAKFAGVNYVQSDLNLPVVEGAIAHIECDIYSAVDAGDHWFVMGKVLRMEAGRDSDPMLFHRGRYGGFAELL